MFRSLLLPLALLMLIYPAQGQDTRKVPISFLPPPLETATYSLGIYDAKSGKLVRHLQEAATTSAFTVGDNGLITSWDGKDDAGKPVPPGKYAARGYAVGALKVKGEDILGNDWANDDEDLRVAGVENINLVPEDNGLVILGAAFSSGSHQLARVARYGGAKTEFLWQKVDKSPEVTTAAAGNRLTMFVQGDTIVTLKANVRTAYRLADGSEVSPVPVGEPSSVTESSGKDGTVWKIEEGVLSQYSLSGERLRALAAKEGEPKPIAVAASPNADRLYLLETGKEMQRVRGLSWKETTQEDGKAVSTWETFFERSIHRVVLPDTGDMTMPSEVEVPLVENPLGPGKPQKIKLGASCDDQGSYLTTADGLRLRRISQRANLRVARLAKGKAANDLTFLQFDRAAWDEFSIEGARNMMEFDAGEFEMTADGEKTHTEKAAEPSDL